MSNNNGASHFHAHPNDLALEGQRIQELIEKIGTLRDPAAKRMLQETLESVLSFYGHGLERIMELVEKAEPDGRQVHDALIHDPSVRGLLLIHGLHPLSLEERLNEALAKVRPYMESHGGNVELLGLENDHARLSLKGHCKTCPSSTVTLELAVRAAIEEACPDLAGFEVEGAVKNEVGRDDSFEHKPNEAPEWMPVEDVVHLTDGHFAPIQVNHEPLLFCHTNGQLYAYRDRCPGCNMPLHLGRLTQTTLTCSTGHRYDIQHAGIGLDDSSHLEPIPLLTREGEVKVALINYANGSHGSADESTTEEAAYVSGHTR